MTRSFPAVLTAAVVTTAAAGFEDVATFATSVTSSIFSSVDFVPIPILLRTLLTTFDKDCLISSMFSFSDISDRIDDIL